MTEPCGHRVLFLAYAWYGFWTGLLGGLVLAALIACLVLFL